MLKCASCTRIFWSGEPIFNSKYGYHCYICQNCAEKELENKPMPNIKITAEVDGKQVPLENISTETFEAIKALKKPKEIPVARVATAGNCRKLIFKVSEEITNHKGDYVAVDLETGCITGYWPGDDDCNCGHDYGYRYNNVKPL